MDKQAPTDFREQVMAVPIPTHVDDRLTIADVIRQDRERVLVVFTERERLLRELPYQQGYMDAKRELRDRIEARLESEASWVDPVLRSDLVGVFDDES